MKITDCTSGRVARQKFRNKRKLLMRVAHNDLLFPNDFYYLINHV